MTALYIIIVIITLIVLTITLTLIFKAKKRKKILAAYNTTLKNIEQKKQDIQVHLQRTNKIAKNEESRELFKLWLLEFEELQKELVVIFELHNKLIEANKLTMHQTFLAYSNNLEGLLFDLENRLIQVDKKIAHYTEFEMDNSRISLSLKERIKELTNTFNKNLKPFEIFNNSFNQQVIDAQIKIDKFETLQKEGEYVEGRETLKECNNLIDEIQFMLKVIINFYAYLTQLCDDINIIYKIKDEVNNIGFQLNIDNFEEKMNFFSESNDYFSKEISNLNFEGILDSKIIDKLQEQLTTLDTEISEFKDIIEEKFTFISEIIILKEDNIKLIEVAKTLIEGAHEEKNIIIKLYELSEIKQLTKIDEEITLFKSFLIDYNKLIDILYLAKEDYETLKGRLVQSNKFIIRIIKNLETSIKELKAIRNDELACRENIKAYQIDLVEIDLYLRKYQHAHKISNSLFIMIEELNTKLTMLKDELDNEPLNITNVRNLNDSVASILSSLMESELEKNIKQRIGSEYLIKYLSRFNKSQDMDTIIKRLNNLYSGDEYKSLLQEGYQLLLSADSHKAAQIYKNIVEPVDVNPFERILSVKNSDVQ